MDFTWSPEQLELRDSIIAFARKELNQGVRERDERAEFPMGLWRQCAAFGLQGLPIPKEYGGRDRDPLTMMLAMEALGYGCLDNGLTFSIHAHMWGCEIPLLLFGTEAQKQKHLTRLCRGEWIGALAMAEPTAGSDAFNLKTTARWEKDHYVLNGGKLFITNGPVADLVVVLARTEPEETKKGITAFLVEKGLPGFRVKHTMEKMGLRTAQMGELVFTDCIIPVENRLGPEGNGVALFNAAMEWERSLIQASAVGTMQRLLDRCIRYARERHQFGQPIGRFQSVANKIVDMQVRLENSRLLLYKVGWLKQQGRRAMMEAAMAKLFVSDCLVQTCLDAIQIHGGYGYLTESELERELRDAVPGSIYSGTSEIQRVIIARYLGL